MRIVSFSKKLKVGRTPTTSTHSPRWTIFRRVDSGEIRLWSILFLSKENITAHGHRSLKPKIECQNLNLLPLEDQLMLVRSHPSLGSLFSISLDFKNPSLSPYNLFQLTSSKKSTEFKKT